LHQHWHKDAIIYSIEVESFQDGNGDGIGDFLGLTERLPYIAGLGFNTIWLLPFHPTPFLDHGYDITDYFGIDPRLGTLGDFVDFMNQAHSLGIRVIIDLVVNHTSNQHPWFKSARSDPKSPFRDFYVWKKEKPKGANQGMVFPGVESSTWTFDRTAGEYYFHRFYRFQPDLNISNPAVREEIRKIVGLWLQLGVAGFRIDAAPFVIELKGTESPEMPESYGYLRELREFLTWRSGNGILLAEANVPLDSILEYFGDGDKMHMLFNFILNQHLFLALARKHANPLLEGIFKVPSIPDNCQWATFLRNHDELDLGRLTDSQRQEVFREFGPQKNMQLYERGIRRRLAPMLDGDLERLKMAYSLLFSLPGAPVIRYGEEIGMGDDLSLKERESIRTPMQWSSERNAGCSTAPATKLFRPVISGGAFGCESVNVADQRRDPNSLLNFIESCIRLRRESPEFGQAFWRTVETNQSSVFAHVLQSGRNTTLAIHNLSDQPCTLQVDLSDFQVDRLFDLLRHEEDIPLKGKSLHLRLKGYDHRWLRVSYSGSNS
jgi:maltose alpha-D-glucosyltransferase / alpha-amylase